MVCIACLGVAALSYAGQPSPTLSNAVSAAGATQVSVFTLPDGNGKALTEAKSIAGVVTDATIIVTLNDAAGNPIYLYPFEDMWLETSLGGLVPCNGGTISDFSTNISGQTSFSAALYAGGYSDFDAGEKCRVIVNGTALVGSDLDILFNSADINGDLVNTLSDTVAFVDVYTGAVYDYKADFSYDGIINLSDLVLYAGGLNVACP